MRIQEKIENDYKTALRNKDGIVVSTLRMLKSALHNKEIEKKLKVLEDAEVLKVIAKEAQQHIDSIEQFTKGNRPELAQKETQELEVLKSYLPQQLSPEEIVKIVKKIIQETGAKEKSDFGKVMKLAMADLSGKAEGKLISQIVSAELLPTNNKRP